MSSSRKQLKGIVVESKMDKTAVVEISRRVSHPVYKKYIIKSKKYYAHDEKNALNVGDTVQIVASKPLSKTKRWRASKLINVSKK